MGLCRAATKNLYSIFTLLRCARVIGALATAVWNAAVCMFDVLGASDISSVGLECFATNTPEPRYHPLWSRLCQPHISYFKQVPNIVYHNRKEDANCLSAGSPVWPLHRCLSNLFTTDGLPQPSSRYHYYIS